MRYVQVTKDPELAVGPFKILQRTTGRFFVYDSRRPIARRSVGCDLRSVEEAESAAHMLWIHEQEKDE